MEDSIGFLYAILEPNIMSKSVRVTIENAEQPKFYKRDEFIDLVKKYGFHKIKPRICEALMRTQTVLWSVKEDKLKTLSSSSEPDSILADLLAVKHESEITVEELPLTEKFSRSEINIDDPENPIFSLF